MTASDKHVVHRKMFWGRYPTAADPGPRVYGGHKVKHPILKQRKMRTVREWFKLRKINYDDDAVDTCDRIVLTSSGDERFNGLGSAVIELHAGRVDVYCNASAMASIGALACVDDVGYRKFLRYAHDVDLPAPGICCAESESETLSRLGMTEREQDYAQALYEEAVTVYRYQGIYSRAGGFVADPGLLEFCAGVAKARFKKRERSAKS